VQVPLALQGWWVQQVTRVRLGSKDIPVPVDHQDFKELLDFQDQLAPLARQVKNYFIYFL
jgi:hypothetical protein